MPAAYAPPACPARGHGFVVSVVEMLEASMAPAVTTPPPKNVNARWVIRSHQTVRASADG